MVTIPPYLTPGDTIAIVSPAGYFSPEKIEPCTATLKSWGFRVRLGNTIDYPSANYFSAPDIVRQEDVQKMMDDINVKAILCARGGYGSSRIIDGLDFKTFKKNPKWIIGFSDITLFHSHVYTQMNTASLHAPMASAFADTTSALIPALRQTLTGTKTKLQLPPHEMNRKGEAVGELIGGNLSLLVHTIGTDSEIKTKGRILFIEDVGEYIYNVDRMLFQLKRSGKLKNLGGLIVGGFTEEKDTERPFGKPVYQVIWDAVKDFDYPVCFGFPVGHQPDNLPLKHGVGHKLKITSSKTILEE